MKITETVIFTKICLMEYKVSDVKPPVQIHTCRNCKHPFSGKICNQCGEKVFDETQLSTKSFVKQIFDFFLHWESKVLNTIKLNFIKPGFITKQNLDGIRVPYAKPIQLYLVVAVIFYLVVSKVGVTDYIPAYGDQEYFSISDYAPFKWAAPLDSAVLRGIDSLWERKGRHLEETGQEVLQQYMQADGSLVIRNSTNTDSLLIKNKAPVMITKMGVSELRVPASALSIPSSAIQKRYAGSKLPSKPERKITSSVSFGICLKYLMAVGSSTIPEKTIRNDATW